MDTQDQAELRAKLIQITADIGIKAKIISKKAGINQSKLSRFKTGQISLSTQDMGTLDMDGRSLLRFSSCARSKMSWVMMAGWEYLM